MAKTKSSSNLSKYLIKSCKILDSLIIDVLLYNINMDTFIVQLDNKNKILCNRIETELKFDNALKDIYQCYLQHCSNLKYYNTMIKNPKK